VIESIPDLIFMKDRAGRYFQANQQACRFFGKSAEELLGRGDRELCPPAVADRFRAADVAVMERGIVQTFEEAATDHAGVLRMYLTTKGPLIGSDGIVAGIFGVVRDISPLRLALEQMRDQETRLNVVVSATKTGVWDWDLRTNGMYYSPYWKESLGYGPDELTASPVEWETRLHPDDRERAFALVKQFLAGEIQTYELEHRLRHRDGSYRWIHTQALLIGDEQGEPVRMIGSHVDITERKRAEQALRQSEERFRRYFELGLIGMAMTAPDKRWIAINDHLCQMLGYSREALMQMSWPEITFPDDLGNNIDLFERTLRGEINSYSLEKRFVHKGGHLVRVVLSCSAIRKDDGTLDYLVVLVHDLTEQKRAEASLRESEVTLQSFFASAALMMGVVKVLPDDIVHLSDNQATADFFGTTVEALRGQRARQLGVLPEILDLWVKGYHRCIAMRVPVLFEYEHEIVRDDVSDRRILSVTVSFIGAGQDGLSCCSYVAEDITERRRAEALLRQAHESLERRVQERTSELVGATQRARVLAQRLYEVQEAERRQLAQDLHDEIGQALTVLKLNLQHMERVSFGLAPMKELHESIAVSDQLLTRVRSLALDLRPSLLDDLGLVPSLRWYATRQAERTGWTLEVDLPDGTPAMSASRSIACFRVVQEALTNVARHAMAKTVSVALTVQGGWVRVAVQDDGCGFDIEAMRISAQQGRSMGLLGMEERIALVGGTLIVESTAGQGARVVFSIPVAELPQEPSVK
jgi:PAS domain S-box-containing protein